MSEIDKSCLEGTDFFTDFILQPQAEGLITQISLSKYQILRILKISAYPIDPRLKISNPPEDIKMAIIQAEELMASSKDPFHDIYHIRRTIEYARVIYQILENIHFLLEPEWEIIEVACAYHDISRINKSELPKTRLGVIWDAFLDIWQGPGMTVKILKNLGYQTVFINKVSEAIYRAAFPLAFYTSRSIDPAIQILADADHLDQLSKARIKLVMGSAEKGEEDEKRIDSIIKMALKFDTPNTYANLKLRISREINKVLVYEARRHLLRDYPSISKLFEEAVKRAARKYPQSLI